MLRTTRGFRGAVTAPHHSASAAGLRVLREGGNALEAAIASAATLTVVYPHMNGLGGDGFWLIKGHATQPVGIDACGRSASAANAGTYRAAGHTTIPARGGEAALTVAGAVAGWQCAYELSRQWGGRLPLSRLFEEAIHYAREGFPVTDSQFTNTLDKREELLGVTGFADTFLIDDGCREPAAGMRFCNRPLANVFEHLAANGLEDFYRGELAQGIADDLAASASPLTIEDLETTTAGQVTPLQLQVAGHLLYNLPPPTQGLASLMTLGVFDRLEISSAEGADFVHALVESTKCAFKVRDREIRDPAFMAVDPLKFLSAPALEALAAAIDKARAAPWPAAPTSGDTAWFGVMDEDGRAVSCIQSLYWEFGSGVVLPSSGIVWQNRGMSFSLDPIHHNPLKPRRKPFHTIQPALACLNDGRVLVYGTMGGDGQPQTQAAIFCRYAIFGYALQAAVTAPRWLLGRTWGDDSTTLKVESRFAPNTIEMLKSRGHDVQLVEAFDEMMGHAGALCWYPDGLIEGAADPRSDGQVAAF